jgi:hypothetical protein
VSIVSDSYRIEPSEQGFVTLEYSSVMDTGGGLVDERRSLSLERGSLSTLADALRTFLANAESPEISRSVGLDNFRVYESGPEQAPYVNLENERAKDVPHGGFSWFAMSKALAEKLAAELPTVLLIPSEA